MKAILKAFLLAYDRRNICSIRGCSPCADFWYFFLTHFVFQILLYMAYLSLMVMDLEGVVGTIAVMDFSEWSFGLKVGVGLFLLYTLFMIFSILPATTLTVRRYHDAGVSGKIALSLFALSLCCLWFLGDAVVDFVNYYESIFISSSYGAPVLDPSGMSILGPLLVAELVFLLHILILASPTGTFGHRYLDRISPR